MDHIDGDEIGAAGNGADLDTEHVLLGTPHSGPTYGRRQAESTLAPLIDALAEAHHEGAGA